MKRNGKIVEFMFVTDDNGDTFNDAVRETVEKFQNDDYYVEVQFTINDKQYGAMVIAREQ